MGMQSMDICRTSTEVQVSDHSPFFFYISSFLLRPCALQFAGDLTSIGAWPLSFECPDCTSSFQNFPFFPLFLDRFFFNV